MARLLTLFSNSKANTGGSELVTRWLSSAFPAIVLLQGSLTPCAETSVVADRPSAVAAQSALAVRESYLDAARKRGATNLPIGIFDSGTGGLAVLQQILQLDQFHNATHAAQPGGDGLPDFAAEQFVFLADQANMPYGNYPAVGKRSFLVQLILEDAIFLLAVSKPRVSRPASAPQKPS